MEATAEEHVDALINKQECRTVPFFVVDPRVRSTGSRGDFPIDVADIVSRDVGTELTEAEKPVFLKQYTFSAAAGPLNIEIFVWWLTIRRMSLLCLLVSSAVSLALATS